MRSRIEVLGLGSPIVDNTCFVSEDFISSVAGVKGGSQTINYDEMQDILKRASKMQTSEGGSAANTITGLNMLGTKCGLTGMIGADECGRHYSEKMEKDGIHTEFACNEHLPTAQAICMVTPDGERTIRCFLGASCEFSSRNLKEEQFENVGLVHMEGYNIYNEGGQLLRESMEMAKRAGAKVSLDLASFEIVKRYRDVLLGLMIDFCDIVFCNEDEAKTLFPNQSLDTIADLMSEMCALVVITLGSKGCLIASGSQRIECKTSPCKSVDSTGAGDLFTSGFLHMYLEGYSIQDCCKVGNLLGGAVLKVRGAQLPKSAWDELLPKIEEIKQKACQCRKIRPISRLRCSEIAPINDH